MPEPLDLDVLTAIHCARPGHGPPSPEGCTFCQLIAELEATRANEKHEERRRSFEAEKYEQRPAELAARAERTEAEALRLHDECFGMSADLLAAEARITAALTIFEEDRSGPNAATANAMYLGLAGEDHG